MSTPFAIAHLSDVHLAPGPRGEEPRRLLLWAVADLTARVAAGLDLVAIVLDGDLYDGATTPELRNLLATCVRDLACLAEVVIVYGNHERRGDLDVLAMLNAPHAITVYARPDVHVTDRVVLPVVPWLDRVTPADDVRTYSVEQAAAREREALVAILDDLAARAAYVAMGRPVVVCGHAMLAGAVPGLGQPTRTGREFVLTLDDLARIPAVAYMLGHVHAPLAWRIGDAPVAYSNSLHRSAFGETDAKRYLLAHVDDGAATIEAVATPATPMVLLTDTWEATPDGDGWIGDAGEHAAGEVRGADVRYQYTVAHAERATARRAALDVKARLEAAGALRVKLDPKVFAPVRAKVAAFAAAQSLDDKLGCYLTREQIDPTTPRVRLARGYLADLERTIGGARGGVAAGGMRLHSIAARGVGPFRDPVRLDLDALPPLVAMMGENGAGKSTLLGCWPGAMFGTVPDGRLLAKLATSPDALVKSVVSVGAARWTLQRHLSRGVAFVVGEDGATVNPDGGIRTFGRWADEHLVPDDVLLAGPFAAQGSEGLIAMRPALRRATLLRALGCAYYERLAKEARDRVATCKTRLASLDGQIAAEDKRRARLPADPAHATTTAGEALRVASCDLDAAEAADARRKAAQVAHDRAEAAGWALHNAVDAVARLEAQAGETAALVAQAEEIREAAREDADAAERVRALDEADRRDAREAERLAERRREVYRERAFAADAAASEARIADMARERLARLVEVAPDMAAALSAAEGGHADDAAALARATAERAALATRAGDDLHGRIRGLRRGLDAIGGAVDLGDARVIAAGALDADDGATDASAYAPRLAALEEEIAMLTAGAGDRATVVAECRSHVARNAAEQAQWREGIAEANEAREKALALFAALAPELATLDASLVEAEYDATQHALDRADLVATRARLAPLASLAASLARAEATRDALAPSLATARERVTAARAAVDALPPAPADEPPWTGLPVATLRDVVQRATAALAVAEHNAAEVGAVEAALATTRAERATADGEREAWALLADALGRTGIQAMEIDAAGPELTQRINDLLHGCFGTRWTAFVDTMPVNGKGEPIDELPITITDAETEREDDIGTYSGGERTILGTALSRAVTGYVCHRAGVTGVTLVGDESGAAVSLGNVEAYVAMLRQAGEEIGASTTILVTQSEEVAALCDAVVRVADGALSVVTA